MLPKSILDHIINNTSISRPRNVNSLQKLNSKSQCSQSFNQEDHNSGHNTKETQVDEQIPEILFKENVSLQDTDDSRMVVSILRKHTKSKIEINFVKKALENLDIWKNQVNLFNQGSSFNNSIFSHMKVQPCQKGEVIFNYGDQGTIYYIVAQGSFSCLIPKSIKQQKRTDDQLNQEQRMILQKNITITQEKTKEVVINPLEELIPINQYVKPSEKQKPVEEIINNDENLNQAKKKIIHEFKQDEFDEEKIYKVNFPNFSKIKVYTPGESFGEIALLTMQKERKATIISRESGILITLDKSKFDKILNIFKELKIRNSLDFLHRFSFLNELGPSKLLSLLHCTEIVKFKKSNIIYKEGDKADNIFFIKSGVIILTKLAEIADEKIIEKWQKEIEENQSLNLNQVKQNLAFSQSQVRVQLVIYKENSFFGEDEIMQDQDARSTKAEVSSFEAEIYIISKQRLFDYLKGSNVYNILVQEYEVKQKWRSQQYKNIISMKQNTLNQYNAKMKQILGEEYRQAYISKINTQMLQAELQKSKNPNLPQKSSKTLVNNFAKDLNLQNKQSSKLNKSTSQQENNYGEDTIAQNQEQTEANNSSFLSKQKEYFPDKDKNNYIRIDDIFSSQDTDNISSPLHQTFRIPPELSDNSFNEILEERYQYKQMVLNQSEKKGKPSNFFIVINPHSKKQQDLDIFKLKKEKTKPVFQKQFLKKRQQLAEQNSKTHSSQDKNFFVEQIEGFSQFLSLTQQDYQHIQQQNDEIKQNMIEVNADEKHDSTPLSLDWKLSLNKQKSSNNSQNDELKFRKLSRGSEQQKQDSSVQTCIKGQQDSLSLQQVKNQVDIQQPQNQVKGQSITQKNHQPFQNMISYKQNHRKIFSDTQFFNKTNPQFYQQQNVNCFKQNLVNPKVQQYQIQIPQSQNSQTQESYVNLFSSRTYKQQSQSNFNSLINEQMLLSQRQQKSQLSLQMEKNNNHQQLLMLNNLDVKSVNIYQQPFFPKRNCKSQQSSITRSPQQEQSPQLQHTIHASPRYSLFSNSASSSPKQQQLLEQFSALSQQKLDTDFIQEKNSSNEYQRKIKTLEKEIKYINIKKIFKNIESSKVFKQSNVNCLITDQQKYLLKYKFNDFDQNQSSKNQVNTVQSFSKNYDLKSKLEFHSKLPKRYSTSPNSDTCNYLQPADFLITSSIQVHKLKKGQKNS